MDLTIECTIDPDDNLELLTKDGSQHVYVTVTECGRYTGIELNVESATKLRDALTDWLGGDAERYRLRLETIRALYPDAPTDAELDIAIGAALQGEQS